MQAKPTNPAITEDVLEGIVFLHVKNGTDTVVRVVKDGLRDQSKDLEDTAIKLIGSQNAVVGVVNGFSDTVNTHMDTVMDNSKKNQERADRIERSERQTRGKLGAQERKRRKEDLDTIARLRNELGVMKRQMRDKDAMVETLSGRVGDLVELIKDMRRDAAERHQMVTDLLLQAVNRRN